MKRHETCSLQHDEEHKGNRNSNSNASMHKHSKGEGENVWLDAYSKNCLLLSLWSFIRARGFPGFDSFAFPLS
jgi:hypothetical protein